MFFEVSRAQRWWTLWASLAERGLVVALGGFLVFWGKKHAPIVQFNTYDVLRFESDAGTV